MNTESIETAEVVPVIPVDQLAEINATEQGLSQLRSRATELAELGVPKTKEAYEEVHRITMVAVNIRTASDKLSKKLAEPFRQQYQSIRAEGKRIGDHAAQSEALTRPLKEQYEAEQERLKVEAEKAAAARIQARVDSITKLGFVFDGTGYNAYDMRIESVEVQALPDSEWDELYHEASIEFTNAQERLEAIRKEKEAEEVRAEQARQDEAARLQKQAEQQQAEAKRLADERAKFEKEHAEFRAQQEKLKADQEQILYDKRRVLLEAVGFTRDPETDTLWFGDSDWSIRFGELVAMDDTEVEHEVYEATGRQAQAELDRLTAENKAVADAKAAADQAKAKQKADKERTARLASDKNVLAMWLKDQATYTSPGPKQPESIEFVVRFNEALVSLCEDFNQQLVHL